MKRSDFIKSSAALLLTKNFNTTGFSTMENGIIKPNRIKKGQKVGITAPAGAVWENSEVLKIESLFKELGWIPVIGKTVTSQDGYLAGTDKERASEFMEFIEDPTIKAIFTMRGGWGSARIFPFINFTTIANNPKIILGFSDLTALLNVITKETNLITFHGPCIYSTWNDYSVNALKSLIEQNIQFKFNNASISTLKTIKSGEASGRLVGGNLTVLTSLIGTKYEPEWQGKVLFLEEIGEEPYRIDRLLWQLKNAGVFEQINGLVLGAFRKCDAEIPGRSFTLEQVFDQYFSTVIFPVFSGASFGHVVDKYTLPIGAMVFMNANTFQFELTEKVMHD